MVVDPIGDIRKAIELFTDIAGDPLSAVLLAFGTLFLAVSVAVLGGLSMGGAISALSRFVEGSGPQD